MESKIEVIGDFLSLKIIKQSFIFLNSKIKIKVSVISSDFSFKITLKSKIEIQYGKKSVK